MTTLDAAVGHIAKFETWLLHRLKGDMTGKWAISVNGNWRIVFDFDGKDVWVVDYKDYP